jgi:hypothetical protein
MLGSRGEFCFLQPSTSTSRTWVAFALPFSSCLFVFFFLSRSCAAALGAASIPRHNIAPWFGQNIGFIPLSKKKLIPIGTNEDYDEADFE